MPSSIKTKTFRSIGNLLKPSHSADVPLFRLIEQLQSIQEIWRAVASPELVEHSRPTYYANGQLTISADSPVWASNIRHQQISLRRQLRESGISDIQALHVRVLPIAKSPTVAKTERDRTSLHVVRAVSASAEAIPDKELRTALLKLSKALRS